MFSNSQIRSEIERQPLPQSIFDTKKERTSLDAHPVKKNEITIKNFICLINPLDKQAAAQRDSRFRNQLKVAQFSNNQPIHTIKSKEENALA